MATTLATMQAGSFSMKWIALIEGCDLILTDCDNTTACQDALAGTDWEDSSIVPGLFVELSMRQSIDVFDPFASTGRCTLRVIDETDTFGTLINKRLSGAETTLSQTADRNDTTLNVASTTGFTSSGDVYIGTERCSYESKTGTTFATVTRGKYSPFECDSSGSGGARFANHHRVGPDANYVQLRPLVTQLPRTWIGKRVGVWLHTWNEGTQTLNVRDDAQLVFAGRLVGIGDDPDTFQVALELEHVLEEVKNGVIGKDLLRATIPDGMWIAEGRTFEFVDFKQGSGARQADPLEVVGSGASTANEMDEGFYSCEELCEKLNTWLASELNANQVWGYYRWSSPVSTNEGLRTRVDWKIEHASDVMCYFGINMPAEVAALLGMTDTEPAQAGQHVGISGGNGKSTNRENQLSGVAVPYRTVVFRPYGPGRVGQEFTEVLNYDLESEVGTFIDQYEMLPSLIKAGCLNGNDWGMWLLDEKSLMIASYTAGRLKNAWLAPFKLPGDKDAEALNYIGRRYDEQEGGPITVRQVLLLEQSFSTLFLAMLLSTGTSGYNHDADTLGYGLGLGIPGQILSPEFVRSVTNMPQADGALAVIIDEPTKLTELFTADLIIRRSCVRWKDQHIEIAQWKTPMAADAVGALTESNKAAPSGQQENHRSASQEVQDWQRPIIKIDWGKDFSVGRSGGYHESVTIEDQTAVDDLGGNVKPFTLKLRNTVSSFAATGAAVEALLPDFIAFMPCVSRPQREITRSIDLRYFEGFSVGDVVTVSDKFARDPLTGRREIATRAAIVTKHSFSFGGPTADGSVRPMGGDVTLTFLDQHRGQTYSNAAYIDDTYSDGDFDAGYNSVTDTIRCYEHKFSHEVSYDTWRDGTLSLEEAADAAGFEAGDKILIVEIDPDDPTSVTSWEREVESQSGNDIVLTTGLSSPAWDPALRYVIVPQKYSQVQTSQQDFSFQADDTDELIEDLDPPNNFAVTDEAFNYNPVVFPGEKFIVLPNLAFGDGRPYDSGFDKILGQNANSLIDYKTSKNCPYLFNVVGGGAGGSTTEWLPIYAGPLALGTEHVTTAVTRGIYAAPFYRSATNGVSGSVRVTICRSKPTPAPGFWSTQYGDARFTDLFASATWTTTSDTWQTGTATFLPLSCKDMFYGTVWLIVETLGDGQTYGLAQMSEGPRVVT